MKSKKRKSYSAKLKAKVALEAFLELKTMSEIVSQYGVHPTQIGKWKQHLKENIHEIFTDKRKAKNNADKEKDDLIEELYKQVGKLKVDLDWTKKKFNESLTF